MHFRSQMGHLGSSLSCADILTFVHHHYLKASDRFILSKGHAASALYATLESLGKIPREWLFTFDSNGTQLPAHPPSGILDGIPIGTGSLGHGLSISVGMAYGLLKVSGTSHQVTCLMSDGECDAGSVWEAALFAQHHGLHNLTVLIDANGLQGFGKTKEVLNLEPLQAKWEAFGFYTDDISGHDFNRLHQAFQIPAPKPRCLILRTVKAKGIPGLEGKLESHYLPLTPTQYQEALDALSI